MRIHHDVMVLFIVIVLTVFATSVLSGILGMAGGMVLMAVLVTTLGVANAMILHGVVQATANGSRAWFLKRYIRWNILPMYLLGAGFAVGIFSALTFIPDAWVVLILVGAFPWLARYSKRIQGLDVTHRPTTVLCGITVTSAQLLAGASGPLLDMFYLNSPLNRQQIVANKAITQTIGHGLKIIYYGVIVTVVNTTPYWLFALAIVSAILGTKVGTHLLLRWNDTDHQHASQLIILTIASLCIAQGVWSLLF